MPTDYERKILRVFSDRYPNSAHIRGGRKLRKGGWEAIFPEIVRSPDIKNAFLDAVERLAEKGIISVQWEKFRKGDKVGAIYLEDPDGLYKFLGEKTPEQLLGEVRKYISSCEASAETTAKIIEFIMENDLHYYELISNLDDIKDILKLTDVTPDVAVKYNIRALSILLFNNSKRIESIIGKADELCSLCGETPISGSLDIRRVYPETTFAGKAKIVFNDNSVWTLNGSIVTLPTATVCRIREVIPDRNNL